jgi:hypothetical protein
VAEEGTISEISKILDSSVETDMDPKKLIVTIFSFVNLGQTVFDGIFL